MNAEYRAILMGIALGDRHINVSKNSHRTTPRSDLRVLHSVTQREYCEYKAAWVNKIFGSSVSVNQVKNGPGGKYSAVHFCKTHKYFKQMHRWLYPDGKKKITPLILGMLSPESIAIWYMDDGHARINTNAKGWISSVSTELATCCTEEECRHIISFFDNTFDIRWKMFRAKPGFDYFSIRMNTSESKKFAALVRPYMIPSMMYKLKHVAGLNLHERQPLVGNCGRCDKPIYEHRRKNLCPACYSKWYYHAVLKHKR